ncbi:MAG: hypothetical protein SFU98_14050 [Leptospiraceae bacterium]|nr:hypothetical protein [Leptospiraceae bacterium]
MKFSNKQSEVHHWEELVDPPVFLTQAKKFGAIYLFDDLKKPLCNGWIQIHNTMEKLTLENLGEPSRVMYELKSIQLFLEYLFEKEILRDIHFKISIEQKCLHILSSESLRNKILLQLTKPNAEECKYSIEEFMNFSGYWNLENSEIDSEPFELKFQYSSSGLRLVLKLDYHAWHSYGEIVPERQGTRPWCNSILKKLEIAYTEIDPCTFEFGSVGEFLFLSDIFRSRVSSFLS